MPNTHINKLDGIIYIPSCGIGYYINGRGIEIPKKNILTPTDTKIRCTMGANLYLHRKQEGYKDIIITGGGIYLSPNRQTKPAAQLMRDYIIEKFDHISFNDIWVENKSLDSWQNIAMLANLLKKKNVSLRGTQIIIVSHWTHVPRLKYLARKVGLKSIRGKHLFYHIGFKEVIKQLFLIAFTVKDPKGESKIVIQERRRRQQPSNSVC